MNEGLIGVAVDFLSKTGNLHIDHVVQGGSATFFLPDLACQHFAGNEMALLAQQIFQELELPTREIERAATSRHSPHGRIHFQVCGLEAKHVRRTAATQQRADTCEQLGKRERLHQIVVGAQIEAEDSILDRVASGQHEYGRLETSLSEGLQDLETAAAGKHD